MLNDIPQNTFLEQFDGIVEMIVPVVEWRIVLKLLRELRNFFKKNFFLEFLTAFADLTDFCENNFLTQNSG